MHNTIITKLKILSCLFGDGDKLLSGKEHYIGFVGSAESADYMLSKYNAHIVEVNTIKMTQYQQPTQIFNRYNFTINPEFPSDVIFEGDMYYTFQYSAIKKIPKMDTSKVTTMYKIFDGCDSLEEIEEPSDWYLYDWKSEHAPKNPILLEKYAELYI